MSMKEFFQKLMSEDEDKHHFTKYEVIMYGILVPLALVLLMGVAGWLETCCNNL